MHLSLQRSTTSLVIDVATLTGSAMAAIGKEGAVMMGTAFEEWKSQLQAAGRNVPVSASGVSHLGRIR